MALVEETLFGTQDKVQIAIERLRAFEPSEGYYVAFSGGKDSQVVYHLCKEAGVKFDAHYNHTTVDPPEVIYFRRKILPGRLLWIPWHNNVEAHRQKRNASDPRGTLLLR